MTADGYGPEPGRCNDVRVLWPDVEAIDVYCTEDPGHPPPHRTPEYEWDDDGDPVRDRDT